MQATPSRSCRNLIGPLLARHAMNADAFCRAAGLPAGALADLLADDRQLPDIPTIQALCMALAVDPGRVVAFAPETGDLGALLGVDGPAPVTICGCGNLGHVFAGLLSARADVRVTVLVSSPARVAEIEAGLADGGGILVRRREGDVRGRPALVTHDPAAAIPGARVVLLCLPSSAEAATLRAIRPYLGAGTLVGAVPAPGGFQWTARELLAGLPVEIFGTAAIPWMCKLGRQGAEVTVLGSKAVNGQSTLGAAAASQVGDVLAHLTGMPVLDFGNFLQITLNPGNQLLHPGILYAMIEAAGGRPIAEPPLFYETLSDRAAAVLQGLSDELMALKARLEACEEPVALPSVLPLRLSILASYGADIADPSSLRSTIATNRAYAGIRTPMVRVDGGWLPNPASRFFHEDVPFGLVVLKGLAELAALATPTLDTVLTWAQGCMGRRYLEQGRLIGPDVASSGAPQRFGLSSLAAAIKASA